MGDAISTHTTKILVKEIKCLEGKYLDKVQQIGADLFKITFSSPKQELLVEPGRRIHFTEYKTKAPMKASNISMFLRKHLKNKKVQEIYQHDDDRIIVIKFKDHYLITEFFSHGNFVLTDPNYKILFTFRKETWKDRELKKGVKYKFPVKTVKPKIDYSPVSLLKYQELGSMSKALDEYYAGLKSESKKLQKLRRRLEKQEESLEEYEQKIQEFKKKADLIYSNYQLIQKAVSSTKQELKELGIKSKGRKFVFDLD